MSYRKQHPDQDGKRWCTRCNRYQPCADFDIEPRTGKLKSWCRAAIGRYQQRRSANCSREAVEGAGEGGRSTVSAAAVGEERLPPVSWVNGEPIHRQCGQPLEYLFVSEGVAFYACRRCHERNIGLAVACHMAPRSASAAA